MARARVLLVEDDAALAELVSWHLERDDFEVELADRLIALSASGRSDQASAMTSRSNAPPTARRRSFWRGRRRPIWCCSTG